MIAVRLIGADGASSTARADPGQRLLDVARAAGLPLEGTCGGEMACSTCHVWIAAADLARLPPPSVEEEDLLDLAPLAGRRSRLACQIVLTAALDGLAVELPHR